MITITYTKRNGIRQGNTRVCNKHRKNIIGIVKCLFHLSFSQMVDHIHARMSVHACARSYNWRASNWFASYRIWDGNVCRMTWLEQWPSQACKHGELYRCSVDWKVYKAWLNRARKKGFNQCVGFLAQFAEYDCASMHEQEYNARVFSQIGLFSPYSTRQTYAWYRVTIKGMNCFDSV